MVAEAVHPKTRCEGKGSQPEGDAISAGAVHDCKKICTARCGLRSNGNRRGPLLADRAGQRGRGVWTPLTGIDTWEVVTQASAGWRAKALCALAEHLEASPQDNLHSVIVVHANRLVFEKYLPGADERWGQSLGNTAHGPDVLHDVRSVTKSVISLLVGIAIDRSLIGGIDDPVLVSFPEYASLRSAEKDKILIRHLLAMSSGLAWDESRPYSDPKNSETRMARAEDPYRFVLEQPVSSRPDAIWNYSGGSTQLLAGIVEKASGMPIEDFAREALFGPYGYN